MCNLRKKYRRCFYIFLVVSLCCQMYGQDTINRIYVKARSYSDSICLRWAPDSYLGWRAGNRYGYKIVRFTIIRNNIPVLHPEPKLLTPEPLKPLPLAAWEVLADSDDYCAIAAQTIYGKDMELVQEPNSGISGIVKRMDEQQLQYSFALLSADLSPKAASASGLWFTDHQVQQNEKYLYRVFLASPVDVLKSDTGYIYCGTDDWAPLPKPVRLQIEQEGRKVLLHWEQQTLGNIYNAYTIARSDDSGKHFYPLLDKPLVQTATSGSYEQREMLYIDSLPEQETVFSYRVCGINSFGEQGPPSEMVFTSRILPLISMPVIIGKEIMPEGYVKLEWELANGTHESSMSFFSVSRSSFADKDFKVIADTIDPRQFKFIDSKPLVSAYYKVTAHNRYGSIRSSLPVLIQLVDTLPPEPPSGLIASGDTTGIITLRWQHNSEDDIYGYRIFRGNNASEELSQLTTYPVNDTVYRDTVNLNTLSGYIYYQIMAIDQRQNHSSLSGMLKVKRPDIVPPAPPVMKSISADSSGIVIQWINSASIDLQRTRLVRSTEKNPEEIVILEFYPKDSLSFFVDSIVSPGIIYSYFLLAQDSSGLMSKPSVVLSGKMVLGLRHKRPENLNCRVDRNHHSMHLKWNMGEDPVRFIIYRRSGENPMTIIASMPGSQREYVDRNIRPQMHYSYSVRAVLSDWTWTDSSLIVEADY